MDDLKSTTHLVLMHYMSHRLLKEKIQWPNGCPEDLKVDQPGKCEMAMTTIAEECEERYKQVFDGMCQQLHITPSNAKATFTTIVDELFSDGVKWGRIVALVSFAGCMGVECSRKPELHGLVDDVYHWTASYLDNQLYSWISDNGGWDGFIEFTQCSQKNDSPWPSLKAICGYAVGALGVLTLGAILSQKS